LQWVPIISKISQFVTTMRKLEAVLVCTILRFSIDYWLIYYNFVFNVDSDYRESCFIIEFNDIFRWFVWIHDVSLEQFRGQWLHNCQRDSKNLIRTSIGFTSIILSFKCFRLATMVWKDLGFSFSFLLFNHFLSITKNKVWVLFWQWFL
jgi:hypothetical protein